MGVRGELFSTKVGLQNRTYFFNVKENRLGDLYLNIVESKNREGEGFDRQSIILFAEDLQDFLQGFDESLRVLEKAERKKRRGSPKRDAPPHRDSGEQYDAKPRENSYRGDRPREGNRREGGFRDSKRRYEGRPREDRPRFNEHRGDKPRFGDRPREQRREGRWEDRGSEGRRPREESRRFTFHEKHEGRGRPRDNSRGNDRYPPSAKRRMVVKKR